MPAAMPAEEEEEDGQPLWQSVAMFCCKGVIEGVIVVLFLWLLIQVLFTKEMEVHLQVLLGAGLVVFCLALLLGCFLCLRLMRSQPAEVKEPPPQEADRLATPTTVTSSSCSPPMRAVSEEPEEEGPDYPSAFVSTTPSDDDISMLPLATQSHASSELPDVPKVCFPLRRLSSPTLSAPLYRPLDQPRASLPCLPRLNFLARTRKVLERRCTVAADSYNERSRLTGHGPSAVPYLPGSSPALSHFPTELSLPHYGTASSPALPQKPADSTPSPSPLSSTDSAHSLRPTHRRQSTTGPTPGSTLRSPSLQFSLCFSEARRTLSLTLQSLSGAARRLGTVTVLARLPPARPLPAEVSARHRSLSPELRGAELRLAVSSLEELRSCVLKLDVFSQDLAHTHSLPEQTHSLLGPTHSPMGQLELACNELDWETETPITCRRRLSPVRGKTQGGVSHDAGGGGQALPQLFILLQHQALAHRLKAMVLKAENLTTGTGTQDHHVVVNLRHAGVVVSSQATQGAVGRNTIWNSPFLFDLPPGDVTQLPLQLEFILIKGCLYSTSNIVGHIVIGQEAEEAGQEHWRDMCNRSQVEVARWHLVQSEAL